MQRAFILFCRHWLSFVAGLIVLVVGLSGLLGWVLGAEQLKGIVVSGIAIKANTAICLLLLGAAVLALRKGSAAAWLWTGRGFAGLASAVGGATLLQHVHGVDFGIDQLLFKEEPGAPATTSPGRMGPPASLALFVAGLSLIVLKAGRGRWGQLGGFAVCAIASIPLLGYAYDIPPLYGISRYTAISMHTAIGLFALGVAIISLRQNHGIMQALCAEDSGGEMARRMLLPALFLPFFFGWLRTLGEQHGVIDPAAGRPLLVVSLTIAMTALAYWNSRAMSVLEDRKRRAEQAALAEVERARTLAEEARERAEAASRVKSEFIARLSHEMRTPLSAVMLRVSAFQQHREFPAALREDLEEMRQNLLLEINLISDLLDLTRIERGALTLVRTNVDLHAVITQTIAMCARPETAAVTSSLRAARHWVEGDKTRLHQIVWNLLTNAQKFTPGDGRIGIETSSLADGRLRVEVRDTGRGFSAQVGARLFNAFEQGEAHDERQRSGLGLGLSITRTLVEAHGGRITASSPGPGQGASFVIELPALAENPPASPPPATKPTLAVASLAILLVEDHAPTLSIMKRLLAGLGHRVTAASNAADARQAAASGDFDVLLTDVGLPDSTGIELLKSFGDRFRGRAIALTGYGTEEDIRATQAAGFAAHLTKPVELAAVNEALAKASGRGS